MENLEIFCRKIEVENLSKTNQAIGFIWFYSRFHKEAEVTIDQICQVFENASLPAPNKSRLRNDLKKSKSVHKGKKLDSFRLSREEIILFNKNYESIFIVSDITVTDIAGIKETPLLTPEEIEAAKRMAELYIIIHCYENSARKLIETVLKKQLGENWWDKSANTVMKNNLFQLKEKELKYKWLTPRGGSPLYYINWGDLVTLIRKYEKDFEPIIGDLKFIEIRMEELERYRNVIAHNGVLDSKDDYDHIILSFKQWCKQVK